MEKDFVIHVKTQSQYNAVLKRYDKSVGGFGNQFNQYKENTGLRITNGTLSTYCDIPYFKSDGSYTIYPFGKVFSKNWVEQKVRFILKYDLHSGDPIEEFYTMAELKKRVEKLLEGNNVVRTSFVVYEVKSVKPIKVKTVITGI